MPGTKPGMLCDTVEVSTRGEVPEPVKCFLSALESGDWTGIEARLAADVLYDASVPSWHYQYEGRDRIAAEYRHEWTGRHPWRLTELNVECCRSGAVVVDFEARWGDDGSEEACRMANIFRFDRDGRIVEHRLYCSGEWEPDTVRHVDESAPRVVR